MAKKLVCLCDNPCCTNEGRCDQGRVTANEWAHVQIVIVENVDEDSSFIKGEYCEECAKKIELFFDNLHSDKEYFQREDHE